MPHLYAIRFCGLAALLFVGVLQAGITTPATSTTGNYTVSFTRPQDNSYNHVLLESTNGGTSWSRSYPLGNGLSKAFSGKAAGTYTYAVQYCFRIFIGGIVRNITVCDLQTGPNPLPPGANWPYGVTRVILAPPTPGAISAPGSNNSGSYTVSWGASSGASRYQLQRAANSGSFSTIQNTSARSRREANLGNATYRYRVRGCNSSLCSGWGLTKTVRVTLPAAPTPPPTPPPNSPATSISAPDATSDAVGVTAGSFRVNESGAATYSIPILAAPGVAGVAPQVALNYSSQGTNGVLGQGWALGGSSAIVRCRQTLETDGAPQPIQLNSTDRYCLDGVRLMKVSGTANIEYRTEIDQYAKIIGYNASSGNPSYFRVWRKDGSVSEYGNTANSKQEAPRTSTAYAWAQNRFADNMGNAITFSYSELSNGEHLLNTITYAGGDATITFNYQSRTDTRFSYVAGSKFETRQRLYRIISRNNGQELRTYTLGYQYAPTTGASQITRITECNGYVCYPATTFTWSNPAVGVRSTSSIAHSDGFAGGRGADINGDGINELLWINTDAGSTPYLHMMYKNASGAWIESGFSQRLKHGVEASWTVRDFNNDGRQDLMYQFGTKWYVRLGSRTSIPRLGAAIYVATSSAIAEHTVIADIHSDGLPDVVYWQNGRLRVQKLAVDPTPASGRPYHYLPATTLSGIPVCSGCDDVRTVEIKPIVADFNGDGQADFLILQEETTYSDIDICENPTACGGGGNNNPAPTMRWQTYVSNGTSYRRYAQLPYIGHIAAENIRTVDINGDGLTDVAYRNVNTWYYYINTGTAFAKTTIGTLGSFQAQRVQFMDYDRDGDADLMYPSGNRWYVRKWNGTTFASAVVTGYSAKASSSGSAAYWTTVFIDIDGDGKVESFTGDYRDHGTNTTLRTIANNPHVPEGVITRFTNGFGARTDITFKTITNPDEPNLYVPATDANSQNWGSLVVDVNAPMWVVQQVQSSAPAAGLNPGNVSTAAMASLSYRYQGYRVQAGGRGPLGFKQITSIDNQTLIKTTTVYNQQFPFTGQPESTKVHTGTNGLLSEATSNWQEHGVTDDGVRRPYLHKAIEHVYPTTTTNVNTGAFSVSNRWLTRTTTTTTMHTSQGIYGDVGSVQVKTETNSGPRYTKTTTNSYFPPNLTKWHLGRLRDATVVHSRSDNTHGDVTRKSAFTYHSNGLLATEVIEPNRGAAYRLTTTYTYDSRGNKTRVRQTGYKGPNLPGESGATTVDRIATFSYDRDGRYLTQSRNHYGHKTRTVDARNKYGSTTDFRDINGNALDVRFGAMGNQYFSRDPAGGFTRTTNRRCGSVGCPTGAHYRMQSQAAGAPTTYTYFDILGREIRQATRMMNGKYTVVLKEYDALGRSKRASEPFESSSASGGTTSYWTTITYDKLGRVTRSVHPDRSDSEVRYNGLATAYTNQRGKRRTETSNALGELVRTQDHLNGFVDYRYDEQGNLASSVQGGAGVTSVSTTIVHDLLGRKTSMTDADMGRWTYVYNAFGEMTRQTNALNQQTNMSYDRLGRMLRRIDADGTDAAWIYDTATKGLGQLHIEDIEQGAATPLRRTYGYDRFARPSTVTTEIRRGASVQTYVQRSTYDQYGRTFQRFDGANAQSGEEFLYNRYGYLVGVQEAARSAGAQPQKYYEITGMDARGNVTSMRKGGITVTRSFEAATGRLDSTQANHSVTGSLYTLDTDWDYVGNLTRKQTDNVVETYSFDDLDRLTDVYQNGNRTLDMSYNALGNITTKRAYRATSGVDSNTDVGTYSYQSGTHRVTRAGTASYTYNANGSMLSGDGKTIAYGTLNKPTSVRRGSTTQHLYYGPNRSRYQRIDNINQSSEQVTHYVGRIERIWRSDGTVETKRYIGGEVLVTHTGSTAQTHYLLRDHLGSVERIINSAGAIAQRMSFDAYGMRRSSTASLSASARWTFNVALTTRGFTGHEGMDSVGLIHMNGRVYDPRLGRFISADPFVQAPHNTQSLNRYSYVVNNPVSLTDPSGHIWGQLAWAVGSYIVGELAASNDIPWLAQAAQVVGCIYGGCAAAAFGSTYGLTNDFGAALRAGVVAGVSSYAFGQIGNHFSELGNTNLSNSGARLYNFGGNMLTGGQIAQQIAANSIVGGIVSIAQGGKFGHGFVSSFVTKATTNVQLSAGSGIGGTLVAVAIGGTASTLTGGKFANGAAYAAFAVAANVAAQNTATVGDVASADTSENRADLQQALDALAADGTLSREHSFESADEAAISVLSVTAPLSAKYGLEVAGNIFVGKDGAYHYTLPQIGGTSSANLRTRWMGYHTHPSGGLKFSNFFFGASSGRDLHWVNQSGKALYLGVQQSTGIGIAVCEPGRCFDMGREGSTGRVLQ